MQPNDPSKTDTSGDKPEELKQNNLPGAPELPGTASESSEATNESQPSVEEKPVAAVDAESAPAEAAVVTEESSVPLPAPAGITDAAPKKRGMKSKLLVVVIAAVLLLGGGGAGAYFGLYVPNKPENIWKSAMSNSGKVYDEAVKYVGKDHAQKAMKIEGSYDLDGAVESDGKVTGEWQGLNGQLNGEVSAAGLKVGFDTRTIKATDDSSDLYFKLTGLQGLGSLLGGGEMAETLNGLNNQWFVVDHTLIEQAASAGGSADYSQQDVKALLEKAGVPTKEYLLASDEQKAVFVVKEQIGSEEKEGRSTYHYKVGYNNENFGKYVEALCNAVKDDKLGKLLLENEKKSCADLGKDAAKEKTDQTADVWVDKRTKLPHVVRVSDKDNNENWVELGQDYQGGDEFPMSLKLRSKEKSQTVEVDAKMAVNTKTDAASLNGTFSFKGGSGKDVSGKFSLKFTPSDSSSIKVEKPEGAKSIVELLNSLGLGGLLNGLGGTQAITPSALDLETIPQSVQ